MTQENIVQRCLEKELRRVEARLAKIKAIFDARPYKRLRVIRKEVLSLIEITDNGQLSDVLLPYVIEQKKLYGIMKQQCSMKLMEEEMKLNNDRYFLQNELETIEMKKPLSERR